MFAFVAVCTLALDKDSLGILFFMSPDIIEAQHLSRKVKKSSKMHTENKYVTVVMINVTFCAFSYL